MTVVWRPAVLILGLAIASCQQAPREPPSAVVVVPNAEEVSISLHGSVWQARYWVNAPYPAQPVLTYIGDSLAADGWKPLSEDFMNPGLPSSHAKGWGRFVDGTGQPDYEVHQWLAQWQNDGGEVVWYALQYRYPYRTEPRLERVEVLVSFNPREVAEQQRKLIRGQPGSALRGPQVR